MVASRIHSGFGAQPWRGRETASPLPDARSLPGSSSTSADRPSDAPRRVHVRPHQVERNWPRDPRLRTYLRNADIPAQPCRWFGYVGADSLDVLV